MAGKQKHAERSRRSNRSNIDTRRAGIYRMASIVDRNNSIRNAYRHQQKGGT